MTLFKSPILVLDTETTGFADRDWSRVVEVGAVLVGCDGAEVACFESFVLPDILDERADGALAVNHITREMLADAPDAETVSARLESWIINLGDPLTSEPFTPYASAFNIAFDRPMLARMGWRWNRWARCIMERASDIMGEEGLLGERRNGRYRWPKLSAAAEFFGVTVDGEAHRALTDARTAARIMACIRARDVVQAAVS